MVRKPRAYLVLEGVRLLCSSASVTNSSTRNSDTFNAEISLGYSEGEGFDAAWWSEQDDMPADVIFTVDGTGGERVMITGQADEIDIDFVSRTVTVTGRDKSAKLSEKRRNQKFNNQKASDIVSQIASDNGLTPVIDTTDDDAGKEYNQDTAHLALNATDFETLSALAEREGCRWYVQGDELHFEPKDIDGDVYEIHYRPPSEFEYMSANFVSLKAKRNLRASKTAKVKVKSWHPKDAKTYEHEEEAAGGGSEALEYQHQIPMLDQAQCEKVAKSKLKDVIRHEMSITVNMPGDLDIDVTQKILLTGTETAFDQEYAIDHIEFSIHDDGAFDMTISNKAPKKGRGKKGGSGSSTSKADAEKAWADGTKAIEDAK
jgi:phage protein D